MGKRNESSLRRCCERRFDGEALRLLNIVAELLGLISAVLLWRQAYRASLTKIALSYVELTPGDQGAFGALKRWARARLLKRDQTWTEQDHFLLFFGLALFVIAGALKLVIAIFGPS